MTQHSPRSPPVVHLLLLSLLAGFTVCRSEAFAASSSHSRFATGRRLPVYKILRGGSSDTAKQHKSPLTCVMQIPPTTQANGKASPEDDNISNGSNSNGSKKSEGSMQQKLILNGLRNTDQEQALSADPVVPAEYVAETKLPTDIGQFQLRAYRVSGLPVGTEPCVIYARDKPPFGSNGSLNQHVPVRIHDQCLTSEVFRSQRYVINDCIWEVHSVLECVSVK
jgi:hypothetical protein